MRSSRAHGHAVFGFSVAALVFATVAHGQRAVPYAAPQGERTSGDRVVVAQAQAASAAEDSAELLAEYRRKVQELKRLQTYNTHLATLVDDQRSRLGQIDDEQARARIVRRDIVPLMTSMVDNLERFVQADRPILLEQRKARLRTLRATMADAGVTTPDKYRQIVEAYQAEMDLGRRLGTYRGELDRDGVTQVVNFLHVGRVLLAYQSEDRSVTAFWNATASPPGWEDLPEEYRGHIDAALRVADRQSAPVLLRVPVPAPKVVP